MYHYDGSTFSNYTTIDGLAHDNVSCFYEKEDGSLWIGTQGGISVYGDQSFSEIYAADVLDDMDINSIIEDDDGDIWIGTRGKAFIYDGKIFNEVKNKNGEAYYNVRCIINDRDGGIWLGGNGGLWRYDGSDFTNYTKSFVGYIYQDKERNIWTSSEVSDRNGFWALLRYDALAINNPAMNPVTILEKADMFFGISQDKDGGIWLGTLNGVCRYEDDNLNYFDK